GLVTLIETSGPMKCYVKATCRYFGFNFFSACFSLPWFDREIAMISCSARNIAKPFLSLCFDLCQFHMTCNQHNRILRCVELMEKSFYILHFGLFNMAQFFANSCSAIRMYFIGHRPQPSPNITIRLLEIPLLEYFTYNLALHL